MKTSSILKTTATALSVVGLLSAFKPATPPETGSVKLRGTRLTYPVITRWITEFNKVYPGIKVQIAPKAPADSIDLEVYAYDIESAKLSGGKQSVIINRYAQLPIANSRRPDLDKLQAKGFTEADFKKIYFSREPGQVPVGIAPIVVYKRDKPACAAKSFAGHYGNDPNAAPGVGVTGDDRDLSRAVKNDPNGLSYNNLGFIYDLKTRKVADSLAIVPLDLNENGKIDANEQFYGTLDEVIAFIEKTNNPKIPVEGIHAVFKKEDKNPAAGVFLRWVLAYGQEYNHAYGFINQEKSKLDKQKEVISQNFTH